MTIQIERLLRPEQHRQAVELQKIYWGDDAGNLVPQHMLHSIAHYGGHILGAYAGTRLVGVLIGFLGTDIDMDDRAARPAMANLLILSKRMLVLPQYRGQNIGFRLKLAQRDIALKQAIRLVTWTVDPLLAVNAHLNFRKLGAVSQRYAVDYFGAAGGENLGGDRLLVEWWVTQRRVQQRAKGAGSKLSLRQYFDVNAPIVNRADPSGAWLRPRGLTAMPDSTFALAEIPSDFRALEKADQVLAGQWRQHIRAVFRALFDAGFIVTDFVSGDFEGSRRAFYLLSNRFLEAQSKN